MVSLAHDWLKLGAIGGLTVLGIAVMGLGRGRARRRNAGLAGSGGGFWNARLIWSSDVILWGADVPGWSLFLYGEGLPCSLVADDRGLTIKPRGPLVTRFRKVQPALIPWVDITGGQAQGRGINAGNGKISFLPLTEVAIGLAGATAESSPAYPDEGGISLRVLTTAPDGLVELLDRRGRARPS